MLSKGFYYGGSQVGLGLDWSGEPLYCMVHSEKLKLDFAVPTGMG